MAELESSPPAGAGQALPMAGEDASPTVMVRRGTPSTASPPSGKKVADGSPSPTLTDRHASRAVTRDALPSPAVTGDTLPSPAATGDTLSSPAVADREPRLRRPHAPGRPAHWLAVHRGAITANILVLIAAAIGVVPYLWMVSSSLRTLDNMFAIPIQWIPYPVNWRSYLLAWQAQDFTRYFFNSAVVSIAITAGNLLLCSLAGYSLAKFRYFGRGLLFILILSTMMLPLEVTMVPLFLIVKRLDWQNTYQGLIVPFLVDGFGVFLMRQYILGIPKDLIDSARIDGASEFRIFWQIVLPLCKPALVALGVFTFREAWDMYIWPLIIVSKDSLRTLPLAISLFMSSYGTAWDQLMAIAVLGTLPMILLFFFLQRAFIQGIAVTGLKE